ncbi:LL-diaminopimelate aminotransferase [bioreactor metagenome]|uniref:LL-diaminopimelate aminotransferase n=1 Tax=bioreactor metagenome TaxID=1076179 RepID=A0A645G1X0_9ZZZZ
MIQRGAEAVFTDEGMAEIKANIDYYRENAKIIMAALDEIGIKYVGGKNSPYIWLKCPNNMKSWDFFDFMLKEVNVVGTPGAGFGDKSDHYFRLTAFGNKERTIKACERIKKFLQPQP